MAGLSNRTVGILILLSLVLSMDAQSFYTIIDDDATSVEAIRSVKKIADEKGVKITFAVNGSRLQDDEIAHELLTYQEQGFQIVSHGWTHSAEVWGNPRLSVIKDDLRRSEQIFDSLGFKNWDYLVYPFGKYSADTQTEIIPYIKERYKLAFNARGYFCDFENFNRYYIPRFAIRWHNDLWSVMRYIDKAVEKDAWIVFLNHSGKSRDYRPEHLESIIDYCQGKGLAALTVDEAYKRLNEQGLLAMSKDDLYKDYSIWQDISDVIMMHIRWVFVVALLTITVIWLIIRQLKK